jgi:tRNA wybutosine-synthesizing protein 1
MISEEYKRLLEHQHYKIVGRHSAVKLCHWLRKSILDEGFCYKQQFYGIESHRCLQMTPAIAWCTHRCMFCWRNIEKTVGMEMEEYDEPDFIIDTAVEKQRELISGFGGIPDRINKQKYREARHPNQAAISLSGEPTIYPKIDELIGEFTKRNYTTYLVTNGTFPERIEGMDNLPTNLYLSLDAPDEEIYRRIDNPLIEDGWERICRTIDLMPSIDTTKVVRLTMVKGWNMTRIKGYKELMSRIQPDFVEVKAYMFVGGSRLRMSIENMPSFEETMGFAQELADELSYKVKDSKVESRVVLLSRR